MNKKSKYKRYETYKDSGVEWIGEIPKHWETLANKFIFKLKKNQVGKRSNEYDLLSLTLRGVIKRNMEKPEGKFPAEFDTYQEVRSGDFVFCLFDVEETPRFIGLSSLNGMITGAYTVLESKLKVSKEFLYYFYLNLDYDKKLKPLYKGLRNTIPKDSFFSFKTLFPPLDEQTAIANFLDDKCSKIDKALSQKEKLITLLKERKQIIIQNAVTKGLDSKVKLKASGIEWIGKIPEHWEVKRLRYIGRTKNGISAGAEYFGKGYPFINYNDVYNNAVLPNNFKGLANSSEEEQELYSVFEDDIFFTRTSETIEEIGISSVCFNTIKKATFAGFLIRFRPIKNMLFKGLSKYFFRCSAHRGFFVKEMNLVTRASLSQETLKNMPVLIPPFDEQKKIFGYLESQTAKIDKAISIQERLIEKLKEYKAILINSAVTGKIKVF
ncbi:MAG: restriction endonuclease subunit S [Leptospiraceae bacterium]|nr:restriction endonuclease subunit S [Leptospiraceae bacterium]MCP5496385.1 restriction endonuclease subunit S [Leptospiraceae bacterium]